MKSNFDASILSSMQSAYDLDSGTSTSSRTVYEHLLSNRGFGSETISFGQPRGLKDEILEVAERCSKSDWDGYGALPIGRETIESAIKLIEIFPTAMSRPDIVPEPSGAIGLEWRVQDQQVFVVAIEGSTISFASALVSGKRLSGEEPLIYELPQPIKKTLAKHFTASPIAVQA
jgi:hypothetical protein